MGIGTGSGKTSAEDAAVMAISSPLLMHLSMRSLA